MTAREALGGAVPALEAAGCDTPDLDALLAGELDEITAALQDAEKRKRLEAAAE